MRSFEVSNPTLHILYGSARAIDINGSVKKPTALMDVLPQTTATVHTAESYNPDTFYTIQNQGSEPVFFSLSATTNVQGPEPVVLNPGETRTRLAQNLAPAGLFLVVKNDSVSTVKIRIWVE